MSENPQTSRVSQKGHSGASAGCAVTFRTVSAVGRRQDDFPSTNDVDGDATLAVVAHGLLTSLSVIQGANLMLRDDWDRLEPDRRRELLDMALVQSGHTIGVLQDLMRGVAPDIAAELDRLASARTRKGR